MEYGSRNVLADPEIREGVKQFSAWPTIPQVQHLSYLDDSSWHVSVQAQHPKPVRGIMDASLNWRALVYEHCRAALALPLANGILGAVQVYVDGEFIGGSDILMKLHQDGDLESMLRGGAKTESA